MTTHHNTRKHQHYAKAAIVASATMAAAMLSACSSTPTKSANSTPNSTTATGSTQSSGTPITIGWISDQSGAASVAGIPNLKGAQLAVAQINNSGGVLGHPLKMLIANGQATASITIAAIQKYVDNPNVFAIIGGSASGPVLAAEPIVDQAHVPWIVDSASAAGIGKAGTELFLTQVRTDYEIESLTKAAIAKYHPKSISVIYATNNYGETGETAVKTVAQADNVPVNKPVSTSVTATDYGPALQVVSTQHPSILISIVYNAGPLAEQAETQGINVPLLFSGSLPIRAALTPLATAGKLAGLTTDITSPTLIADNTTSPQMNNFVKAYDTKYGEFPGLSGLNGYNAVEIFATALKKAGKVSRSAFTNTLRTMGPINLGLTYPEQFTAQNQAGEKQVSLITFKDNTVPGPNGLYGNAVLTPGPPAS